MKLFSRFGLSELTGRLTLGIVAAIMLVTFCPDSSSAELDLCTRTSTSMLESCQLGAQGDYWLAVAKCKNFFGAEKRTTCKSEAERDLNSGTEECQAQYEERLNICVGLGEDAYNPFINPADFVAVIDNPYFPLTPGNTYIYEGITESGLEHIEVNVTLNTKEILGVTCIEVRDAVTIDGVLVEDTLDWFAQDTEGNVWYFGENSRELDADGLTVSLEGSWTAGVDGAKPGIIMKTNPQLDDFYRQEFALGDAEDMAKVKSLSESVTVPYQPTPFTNCLKTKEFSPLSPGAIEHKFYAPGIGPIQEVDVETGNHIDLINIITPQ